MDFAVYWRKNSLDTFAVAVQFFQIWFAACWKPQKKHHPTLSLSLALSRSNMAMDTPHFFDRTLSDYGSKPSPSGKMYGVIKTKSDPFGASTWVLLKIDGYQLEPVVSWK